ncbi:MAG: hypothetical protein IJ375_05560 [Oscillospiraceae bacterium]|nr:hypothetical protein [Oscillospiraceae bacterium]
MKKRTILIIAVVIAALLIGVIGALVHDRNTYITIGGQRYPRSTEALSLTAASEEELGQLTELQNLKRLDLRKSQLTTAQFDTLRAALPECEILWKVPFQGGSVSSDTTKLNITSLSAEDIPLLDYFPDLTKVNARGCADYDQLLALAEARPDLELYYTLSLGGEFWPNSTTVMTVDITPAELEAALKYLPNVTSVTLSRMPENPEEMLALQESYPGIEFFWQLEVCGVTVDNTATEIDLSNIPMEDTQELESKLQYLPNLTKVDMCGCGISNEEMEALNDRHEDTLFVWIVNIGPYPVRTDITYYIPVKYQQRVGNEDCKNLRYCTELVALDLGHMPIVSCEFVSYMPHLKYLILADTSLMSIEPLADLKELVFLEIFLTYVTDYSPLLTVTSLEDLNISHTHGDLEPLTQMTWLKRLWWGANPGEQLSRKDTAYLQECLPDTTVVTDFCYSTGRGWRQGGHYYDMRDYFGMWYMDQG